jgi:hypothetical protein
VPTDEQLGHRRPSLLVTDGKDLVFTGIVGTDSELFKTKTSGANPTNLTHHPALDADADWRKR